jgi:Family of unknown function (DUF6263)
LDKARAGAVALLIAASAALVACGDDDDGGGGGTEPSVGDDPVVELTDPGDGPRRRLVLEPEVGSELNATMGMTMEFDTVVDGEPVPTQDVPPLRMQMSMVVDDATSERIDSTFEYGNVRVGEGTDPALAATIEQALAGLEGVTGTLSTTASGQLIEADVQVPADIDPTLSTFMTQIEDQLRSLTVPFPSEPVGPGATWTVDTALDISGVISQTHATYTLQDLRDNDYVLQAETEQTVEPGSVEGAPGEILGGDSTGIGRIEGRFDSLFPILSEATTSGSTTIEVPTEEGDEQELEQDITIDLNFRSRPNEGG